MDTAGDIVQRIAESLGLNPTDGWALYQVRSLYEMTEPDYPINIILTLKGPVHGRHSHIKAHEFVCDVLAGWEIKQEPSPSHSCNYDILTFVSIKYIFFLLKQVEVQSAEVVAAVLD